MHWQQEESEGHAERTLSARRRVAWREGRVQAVGDAGWAFSLVRMAMSQMNAIDWSHLGLQARRWIRSERQMFGGGGTRLAPSPISGALAAARVTMYDGAQAQAGDDGVTSRDTFFKCFSWAAANRGSTGKAATGDSLPSSCIPDTVIHWLSASKFLCESGCCRCNDVTKVRASF